MKTYKVLLYECLKEKILYIYALNYYFGLRPECELSYGEYQWTEDDINTFLRKESPEELSLFLQSSYSKREAAIKDYSETKLRKELEFSQYTMCFHPSRKCNLQCRYCFGTSDYLENYNLSVDTMKRSIDYMIYEYAPYAIKYIFDFSGSGEPLLSFDLIKDAVEYCKEKRQEIGKAIEIMFCTNLTLMTPEMVDYFEKEPIVLLGTSIDGGKKVHDQNRIYKNGKGTFDDIKQKLSMFKTKKFGIAATVTPLCQNVDEIFDDLYHLPSVDCVSMRFIRDHSGSEYDFENFDIDYLMSRYEKLCENIYSELEAGNFDYIVKLVNGSDLFGVLLSQNLQKGGSAPFRCEMAKSRVIVGASGDLYSCSVMMGSEAFKIGTIEKGVDPMLVRKYWKRPKDIIRECRECSFNNACGGDCFANSYLKYGDMQKVNPKSCELTKRLNLLSYAFLERLKRQYPRQYEQFVTYSFRVNNFTTTNSAIWALVKWSKILQKPLDYEMLMREIDTVECTTDVSIVLNFMRSLVPDADSYQIDASLTSDDFTRSGIAVMKRKKHIGGLEYLVVYGMDHNNVIYESMLTRGITSVSLDMFLSEITDILLL